MPKISYMGDGTTTEFNFNFPYFEDDNIIVTKNNESATGYTIVGTSAGLNADIPYTGGKIVFNVAPTALDSIIISRSLPLTRIVDYQPTEKINPTLLNQDINYTIEVLKDFKTLVDDFSTRYAALIDIETIQVISTKIDTLTTQIIALGDISTLRQNVTTNTNDITSLKDASNFTTTGKTAIAHMVMPSNRYVDLTLGSSGDTYTMPADGYLWLRKQATSVGEYMLLQNTTSGLYKTQKSATSGGYLADYIHVSKNDVVKIEYTLSGDAQFKLFYANGAE